MIPNLRPVLLAIGFVLLAALHPGQACGGDAAQPTWDPKVTAKYLDERAEWWLGWSGASRGQGTTCISCHTGLPIALARPALGARLGESAPGAIEKKLIDNVKKRVENWDKIIAPAGAEKDPFVPYYVGHRKPSAFGTESVMNALVLVNHDVRRAKGTLSASTRQALAYLWEQQQPNGAWLWLDFGLNPWESDGAYYGASLAAVAVGMAGKEYVDRADIQPKLVALRKYLHTQFAKEPLHHRAAGLWASSLMPGILTEEDTKQLVAELLKTQEADGGWRLARLGKRAAATTSWQAHGAYPEGAVSDGYATGLVVLALKRAGVSADHPQLKKGIAWLVTRQQQGTWPVIYPNRPRNPQDNIGKFMRDAATGFAILALTESP
jgi:squalene-hopene/tetraprenyl-beta-curcumene cyclase